MIGHNQILRARRKKMKPSVVFINIDVIPAWNPRWKWAHPENALAYGLHPEIFLSNNEAGKEADWRFLVGCRVHIHCLVITDSVRRLALTIVKDGATLLICYPTYDDEVLYYKDGKWQNFTKEPV